MSASAALEIAERADPEPAPPATSLAHPPRRTLIATLLVAAVLALVLYRPWDARPFDILDFSEFLPLLTKHEGWWERVVAFTSTYFTRQGRANVIEYGVLSLKWTLFGGNVVAWQMARAAWMLGIVGGVFLLLQRLGSSARASAVGALLFVVATSASQGWTRLTMGEPLALGFLLVASHVAVGYSRSAAWRRDTLVIALAMVLVVLTKEILVCTAPFVLALALVHRGDGVVAAPARDRRAVGLVIVVALACAAALVPAALATTGARAESYASSYGAAGLTPAWYAELLARLLLAKPLLFPGNLLLLALTIAGLAIAARQPPRDGLGWRIALALLLPACGALAYVPWPRFERFYALPFLLGVALLLALALTALERRLARAAWGVYAIAAIALGYHALDAAQGARESAARQRVNARVAEAMARHANADTIRVATAFLVRQQWQGLGPTLGRYAGATHAGMTMPPVVDVPCDEAGRRYRQGLGRDVLVSYSNQCGTLPSSTLTVRERFRYVDWLTLGTVQDSLRADVVVGVR